MDVRRDYYAVLGLTASATAQEIKSAYRALARRLHPDSNAAADAAARFQQIQEAYEILSDGEQKQAYDRWREKEGLVELPALTIKATTSHSVLPLLDEGQLVYILLEIAHRPDLQVKRLPLNLCLVIDRSTSMQGVRLARVKDATNLIIDALDDVDVFSLVTFGDRAEVVIPAQSKLDKPLAKSRVSTIRSAGGTEILQGMMAGLSEIDRWRSPNMVNQLILLTDGQTYGDEQECVNEAQAAAERQISITTMGIGQDWNDKLLDEIARTSGGTSIYVDSASRVTYFFQECLQALAHIVARDLRLTIRLSGEVAIQSAFRVSPHMEHLYPDRGTLSLGQLGEAPASFVLETLISPRQAGRMRIAQLELAADVLTSGPQPEVIKQDIAIELVEGLGQAKSPPPSIVSILGKLAIFRMQEKAMKDLEEGQFERASQRLETMATRLLNIGENELAKAALLEAGRLARTGHLSPEGRKRIRYGTRGLSVLLKEVGRDQV